MFQSTPPRGRRHHFCPDGYACSSVSIHASAWEATFVLRVGFKGMPFQSTPPRGRRHPLRKRQTPDNKFQSTPPRGRRLLRQGCRITEAGFNPRLRVGGDACLSGSRNRPGEVSIHASAWEATEQASKELEAVQVSIHASAWEATQCSSSGVYRHDVSIHASAWEATIGALSLHAYNYVSIHASAWEATFSMFR